MDHSPQSLVSSQNYDLSLKLESQRIVADFLSVQNGPRSSNDSVSTGLNDSLSELKGTATDDEMGWDGSDDSEVRLPTRSHISL